MYGMGADPFVITIDPSADDINLPPELTQGPYIPPPNAGTATALLRASIAANAPGASDVLHYGTLADKASVVPQWAWLLGGGFLLLTAFGRRR